MTPINAIVLSLVLSKVHIFHSTTMLLSTVKLSQHHSLFTFELKSHLQMKSVTMNFSKAPLCSLWVHLPQSEHEAVGSLRRTTQVYIFLLPLQLRPPVKREAVCGWWRFLLKHHHSFVPPDSSAKQRKGG